ncbi:YajG family lipoprotein [Psychromonas aquimarina]|uniref:YajG family lipoprotein n=1 Tax=Psychromonas aquimarina TaxID=444919 RepID=UPI0004235F7C|nr:YajG family lipoprotein [Psychromonas aquimarina]
MLNPRLKPVRLLTLILSSALLFSCSGTPTSTQLQPQLSSIDNNKSLESSINWSVSSQDRRIAHYLIEISTGDDAAVLINESAGSKQIIEQALRRQWLKQGMTLVSSSPYQIDIQVIKLLSQVKQSTLSHEIDSNIVIKVQLNSETKTFSKTFKAKYSAQAPFQADIDELSEKLNTQLSQLLNEIVQDPELKSKLLQL